MLGKLISKIHFSSLHLLLHSQAVGSKIYFLYVVYHYATLLIELVQDVQRTKLFPELVSIMFSDVITVLEQNQASNRKADELFDYNI